MTKWCYLPHPSGIPIEVGSDGTDVCIGHGEYMICIPKGQVHELLKVLSELVAEASA